MSDKNLIAEDVAIVELSGVIEFYTDDTLQPEEVKEKYPSVLKAIMLGLLVFDEDKKPTYTLKEAVMNASGGVALDKLELRTRIVASEQKKLAQGLDMKKNQLEYIQKCMAYLIKQPVAMLDKLGRFDEKVIDQLTTFFL